MSDTTKTVLVVGGVSLLALGTYLTFKTPRGKKKVGDALIAKINFRHQGPADRVWVGFGLAKHQALFGGAKIAAWFYQEVDVPAHTAFQMLSAPALRATLPQLEAGSYDALVFIQKVNGPLTDYRDMLSYRALYNILTIVE